VLKNHTFLVDYFALGVFGYECIMGRRPYVGKTRKEIKEHIMSKQVQIKEVDKPQDWTDEAIDFVNKLIQRKPSNRLGLKGPTEVKEHPWLKDFDWTTLYKKKMKAPFLPKVGDNFDKKYCDAPDKMGEETKERYQVIFRELSSNKVFNDFLNYDAYDKKTKKTKFYNPHEIEVDETISKQDTGISKNLTRDVSATSLKSTSSDKLKISNPNTVLRKYKNSSSSMVNLNSNYVSSKEPNSSTNTGNSGYNVKKSSSSLSNRNS